MNGGFVQPRVFVGSSVEGLDIAYSIQENLDFDAEVTVWTQGIFNPSDVVLAKLLESVPEFDFAVFVFSADDVLTMRGEQFSAVRDNVIFELGLFFGGLGRERCFHVVPRSASSLRLPSDLLGIIPLTFNDRRSDHSLVAAVGAACNQIRRSLRKHSDSRPPSGSGDKRGYSVARIEDYASRWNSQEMMAARASIRNLDTDPYGDTRDGLWKVFAFLESLSDAVLADSLSESEARKQFGAALVSAWPWIATVLAQPGDADDFWTPLPKIAELYARWSPEARTSSAGIRSP